MPRPDRETIAALAEGRLDPVEAAALEREINTDPVAAAELATQRLALEAISQAPRSELSTAERSTLRTAVADALGITEQSVSKAPPTRRIPWNALGIAAAALVGLVAIVPVTGLLSTNGGDATAALELPPAASTMPAAAESSEVRSATIEQTAEAETFAVVGADEDDGLVAGEAGASDAATFGSSTTLLRTTTTTAVPATTSASAAAPETTTTSEPAPEFADEFDQLTTELAALKANPAAVELLAGEAGEGTTCWIEDNTIRTDPPPQRFVFEYDHGELTVIVYYELAAGEVGPFQVWGLPDCASIVVVP